MLCAIVSPVDGASTVEGVVWEVHCRICGLSGGTVTVLAAIIVVLVVIVALRGRGRRGAGGHLDVQKLNDFYKDLRERVRHARPRQGQPQGLAQGEQGGKRAEKHPEQKSRSYVLDFDGDIKASATEQLPPRSDCGVLSMAGKDDEVVLRLESGDGIVHGYGLAASQLARIRQVDVT